jgi:hypothetical protein
MVFQVVNAIRPRATVQHPNMVGFFVACPTLAEAPTDEPRR